METTDISRFVRITDWMAETFKQKNHDYGNAFAKLFEKHGMAYPLMHLEEKFMRIETLAQTENLVQGERINDSLLDMANYCILTLIELEKKCQHTK